jgi:hypothetical protein
MGAALVELGALAADRKAWVSLVGAVLVGLCWLPLRKSS